MKAILHNKEINNYILKIYREPNGHIFGTAGSLDKSIAKKYDINVANILKRKMSWTNLEIIIL